MLHEQFSLRSSSEGISSWGKKKKNRSVLCALFLKEKFLLDLMMVSSDKILGFRLLRKDEAGNCSKDLFPSAGSAGSYGVGVSRTGFATFHFLFHLNFPLQLSVVT